MLPATVEPTWQQLADGPVGPAFDPLTIDHLPEPAQRWLRHALPDGVPLRSVVKLRMTGRIRLGSRWLPFTAEQVLHAGVGFVWKPVVGGGLLRFTGVDLLGPDDARMEFRLHGLVPVVRADGEDIARSAAGRLAAETVAWLPQAATPQLGARWRPDDADADRAVVALATPSGPIDVRITVDHLGRLVALHLNRWNGSADPPADAPFGGELTADVMTAEGVRIAGDGTVGWDHDTPDWDTGRFFEFSLEPPGAG